VRSGTRRVVVTGMGAVTCLGAGADALWQGLQQGRDGFGPVTRFDTSDSTCKIGGQVPDDVDLESPFDSWPERPARLVDRVALLAVDEALGAADLAALPPALAARAGVSMLCGSGDLLEYEHELARGARPVLEADRSPFIAAADWVAWRHRLLGPRLSVVTACSSGLIAVTRASEAIRRGEAELMIAGGADVLSRLCFNGFQALRAMDPEPCKPFDARRRGMTLGDGGAALVLEEREQALSRGAPVLAELLGYGMTQDAYHIATPDESGQSWARTLCAALDDAGLEPAAIDYVNAHATATELNDRAETAALKLAFGDAAYRVPVSSIKGSIGHCQFAAGVVELVATIQAMRHGVLPPTLNLTQPDPRCDLDYVPLSPRAAAIGVALCNSFGFGGSSAVLVLGRADR